MPPGTDHSFRQQRPAELSGRWRSALIAAVWEGATHRTRSRAAAAGDPIAALPDYPSPGRTPAPEDEGALDLTLLTDDLLCLCMDYGLPLLLFALLFFWLFYDR